MNKPMNHKVTYSLELKMVFFIHCKKCSRWTDHRIWAPPRGPWPQVCEPLSSRNDGVLCSCQSRKKAQRVPGRFRGLLQFSGSSRKGEIWLNTPKVSKLLSQLWQNLETPIDWWMDDWLVFYGCFWYSGVVAMETLHCKAKHAYYLALYRECSPTSELE